MIIFSACSLKFWNPVQRFCAISSFVQGFRFLNQMYFLVAIGNAEEWRLNRWNRRRHTHTHTHNVLILWIEKPMLIRWWYVDTLTPSKILSESTNIFTWKSAPSPGSPLPGGLRSQELTTWEMFWKISKMASSLDWIVITRQFIRMISYPKCVRLFNLTIENYIIRWEKETLRWFLERSEDKKHDEN